MPPGSIFLLAVASQGVAGAELAVATQLSC